MRFVKGVFVVAMVWGFATPPAAFAAPPSERRSLVGELTHDVDVHGACHLLRRGTRSITFSAISKLQKHLGDAANHQPFVEILERSDSPVQTEAMLSLCALPQTPPLPAGIVTVVKNRLDDSHVRIRHAAARVIANRFPNEAEGLIARIKNQPHRSEWLRPLCLTENARLIWPLLTALRWSPGKKLPRVVGYLVRPEWLHQEYKRHPQEIQDLAQRFGYTDQPLDDNALELLRQGFSFVTPEIQRHPDIDSVSQRGCEIERGLLSFTVGMMPPKPVVIDASDPLEQALLIDAARDVDQANISAARERNPYEFNQRGSIRTALCTHTDQPFCRRILIESGLIAARDLGLSEADSGEFLVDRAAAQLHLVKEQQIEARSLLISKWHAIRKAVKLAKRRTPERLPVVSDDDFPLLKYAVVDAERVANVKNGLGDGLSPGAAAAVRLAAYAGHPDIEDTLRTAEEFWRNRLQPIGCELQVPPRTELRSTYLAAKQALRFLGIPSPRRPIYGAMIEASMRPAQTFHAPILTTVLLAHSGLLPFAAENACHLSIEGELGEQARYLGFAQYFISPRRHPQPGVDDRDLRARHGRLTRLMSKGFIHFHSQAERCLSPKKPVGRTELRGFILQADNAAGQGRLNGQFVADMAATQLLASAMQSEDPALQRIWTTHMEAIDRYTRGLPAEFAELLATDWYECTADPDDAGLVGETNIIQKIDRLRAAAVKHGLSATKLRRDFRALRDQAALSVYRTLANGSDNSDAASADATLTDVVSASLRLSPELRELAIEN